MPKPPSPDWVRWLFRQSKRLRNAIIQSVSLPVLRELRHRWQGFENEGQAAPKGTWRTWLLMAGRGFGKTRAGAEWVAELARSTPGIRIALVGATMEDARSVMVEGESGILSVLRPHERAAARWSPATNRIDFGNGSIAHVFSADAPEKLRGFQHHFAWGDELGKWRRAQAVWDNLMMGLRLGNRLQTLVTTTPKAVPLLRRLRDATDSIVHICKTAANSHVSRDFRGRMEAAYGGTRLGRQELDGELLEDMDGALWTREGLEQCRTDAAALPKLERVVVGVDPAVGGVGRSKRRGDECGIVVAGLDRAGICHVIADETVHSSVPSVWTRKVAEVAARHNAGRVVVEANQGGRLVEEILLAADPGLPVGPVHAWRAKWARAEPVSLRYAQGRVTHAGAFPELEDQLCGMIAAQGYAGPGRSPDRADALIWALAELLPETGRAGPRVRRI